MVGEIVNSNTSVLELKLNPGSLVDGGAILNHLHRSRKSSLRILDLAGVGLGDRGGVMFRHLARRQGDLSRQSV